MLRSSTLLKSDIWRRFIEGNAGLAVRGTVSFRSVPGTSIYATGQPTIEGIQNGIAAILDEQNNPGKVVWINLREEPLVYISGKPYCLRPSGMSLRNLKAFSGISWRRLQQLEDRLKGDVLAEIKNGDGRLLLHTEDEEGAVIPVWEEAAPQDVDTVADIMHAAAEKLKSSNVILDFRRIPITAEKIPDPRDMEELLHLVMKSRMDNAPLVVNDQLGRGRATLTLIIILLVTEWMDVKHHHAAGQSSSVATRPALQYHLINSLIRVLPRGLEVKRRVDDAIDRCSQVINVRDAIDEARQAAEDAEDPAQRAAKIDSGIQNLRRYFQLLVFEAYLHSTRPSIPISPTFAEWVESQPVLETLTKEMEEPTLETITALPSGAKEGVASETEEQDVISNRHGAILSPFTMLKSDFFPGILKGNLPLHVDGMPNMRGIPMQIVQRTSMTASTALKPLTGREIWGQGMPSVEGLRNGLGIMGASPDGPNRIVWTCLREEPVLYVKGKPHVLRLADQPLTNVEATGIATEVVERMENALKADVLAEAKARDGLVLLHDEVAVDGGKFEVVPVWETVTDVDVLTPREVSRASLIAEGRAADLFACFFRCMRWWLPRVTTSTMRVSPSQTNKRCVCKGVTLMRSACWTHAHITSTVAAAAGRCLLPLGGQNQVGDATRSFHGLQLPGRKRSHDNCHGHCYPRFEHHSGRRGAGPEHR